MINAGADKRLHKMSVGATRRISLTGGDGISHDGLIRSIARHASEKISIGKFFGQMINLVKDFTLVPASRGATRKRAKCKDTG
jgi:hypothetical protein